MYQSIAIFFLAAIGFCISFHIWRTKRANEKLVCIIGQDCDIVVHSKYAATFGIPNEILGMLYYLFIMAVYGTLFYNPAFFAVFVSAQILSYALIAITGFSALFSAYLTYIQIFVLKELCEWCLGSAAVNMVILLLFIL